MIDNQFRISRYDFAHNLYTSYLWCTGAEEMCEMISNLIEDAEEYGIELDYQKFGIIRE